ncbi:MAG: hypothetical protein IT426_05775 [Pirellulales bacterium]|nr:hypothetical protein [Pirellulales bacterium]
MNEELKQQELARRLEQATAAESQGDLDPEVSAWREGWMAWGNLLQPGNNLEKAAIERLLDIPTGRHAHACRGHEESVELRDMPTTSVGMAPDATRARRSWAQYASVASATLAVSLLLAIGMLKFAPVGEPPPDENRDPSGYPFHLAWDDGLEYSMTRIEERLTVAQYDSVSLGNSFDIARSRLENLSREIELNSM